MRFFSDAMQLSIRPVTRLMICSRPLFWRRSRPETTTAPEYCFQANSAESRTCCAPVANVSNPSKESTLVLSVNDISSRMTSPPSAVRIRPRFCSWNRIALLLVTLSASFPDRFWMVVVMSSPTFGVAMKCPHCSLRSGLVLVAFAR
jgi:hypothetical protein